MPAPTVPDFPDFVILKKSELDDLIRQLDHIHMALDFLLERQEARRDLAELLPKADYATQNFLLNQRLPRKPGGAA